MEHTKLIQGFPSNSASPSDIWLVRDLKDQRNLIAKIFIRKVNLPKDDSSSVKRLYSSIDKDGELLHQEAVIYKKIKRELIISRKLPFYASLRYYEEKLLSTDLWKWCLSYTPLNYGRTLALQRNLVDNIEYMFDKPSKRQSLTADLSEKVSSDEAQLNAEKIKNWAKENVKFNAIVTTMIEGGTLLNWIREDPRRIFSSVIPALFFAIYCLAEKGINQNDLHWSNVLIEKKGLDVGTPRFVVFGDHVFLLEMNEFPVLYDFDRGVLQGKRQPLLRGYAYAGNCEEFHKNRDIVKSMCVLYHECDRAIKSSNLSKDDLEQLKDIKQVILTCLNNKRLVRSALEYRNCRFKNADKSLLCSKKDLDSVRTEEFISLLFLSNCTSVKRELFARDPLMKIFAQIVTEKCTDRLSRDECIKKFIFYSEKDKHWVNKLLKEQEMAL